MSKKYLLQFAPSIHTLYAFYTPMPPSKYQCHFCPEVFEFHTDLFKHQRTKHVKKSTTLVCQCAICGIEFLDFDSKTSHVHKKHPELMDRLFQAEKNLMLNSGGNLVGNEVSGSASNPYKQKENSSRLSQKSKITESNSFLATLLKWWRKVGDKNWRKLMIGNTKFLYFKKLLYIFQISLFSTQNSFYLLLFTLFSSFYCIRLQRML